MQQITTQTPVFKQIKYLVIHCTATPEGKDITGAQLKDFFTRPVAKGGRGWTRPGYVDIIRPSGHIDNLVPYDDDEYMEPREITNGVAGFNSVARSFAYVGGLAKDGKTPKDTRTELQKEVMAQYIKQMLYVHPSIIIAGHRQFPKVNKACPSFDVPTWLRSIGVPERNIFKSL